MKRNAGFVGVGIAVFRFRPVVVPVAYIRALPVRAICLVRTAALAIAHCAVPDVADDLFLALALAVGFVDAFVEALDLAFVSLSAVAPALVRVGLVKLAMRRPKRSVRRVVYTAVAAAVGRTPRVIVRRCGSRLDVIYLIDRSDVFAAEAIGIGTDIWTPRLRISEVPSSAASVSTKALTGARLADVELRNLGSVCGKMTAKATAMTACARRVHFVWRVWNVEAAFGLRVAVCANGFASFALVLLIGRSGAELVIHSACAHALYVAPLILQLFVEVMECACGVGFGLVIVTAFATACVIQRNVVVFAALFKLFAKRRGFSIFCTASVTAPSVENAQAKIIDLRRIPRNLFPYTPTMSFVLRLASADVPVIIWREAVVLLALVGEKLVAMAARNVSACVRFAAVIVLELIAAFVFATAFVIWVSDMFAVFIELFLAVRTIHPLAAHVWRNVRIGRRNRSILDVSARAFFVLIPLICTLLAKFTKCALLIGKPLEDGRFLFFKSMLFSRPPRIAAILAFGVVLDPMLFIVNGSVFFDLRICRDGLFFSRVKRNCANARTPKLCYGVEISLRILASVVPTLAKAMLAVLAAFVLFVLVARFVASRPSAVAFVRLDVIAAVCGKN